MGRVAQTNRGQVRLQPLPQSIYQDVCATRQCSHIQVTYSLAQGKSCDARQIPLTAVRIRNFPYSS